MLKTLYPCRPCQKNTVIVGSRTCACGVTSAAEDGSIAANVSGILEAVLAELPQREMQILKLRYGIGVDRDHTLEEIGQRYALSRERIRQILEVALTKLRDQKNIIQLKEFVSSC